MPETPFRMDGPYSVQATQEAADLVADGIRFLNLSTRDANDGGLSYPADAYHLLAALYAATGRMGQLAGQISAFLDGWQASGQLRDANGRDATTQVAAAADSLRLAGNLASSLTTVLQNAQNAISGLYVREDPDA